MRTSTTIATIGALLVSIVSATPNFVDDAGNTVRVGTLLVDEKATSIWTVHIFEPKSPVSTPAVSTIFIQPVQHLTSTITVTRQPEPRTTTMSTTSTRTSLVVIIPGSRNTTLTTTMSSSNEFTPAILVPTTIAAANATVSTTVSGADNFTSTTTMRSSEEFTPAILIPTSTETTNAIVSVTVSDEDNSAEADTTTVPDDFSSSVTTEEVPDTSATTKTWGIHGQRLTLTRHATGTYTAVVPQ